VAPRCAFAPYHRPHHGAPGAFVAGYRASYACLQAQGGSTLDGVGMLEDEVRELIRRSGLDPARDVSEVQRLVRAAVTDYDERSLHGGMPTLPDLDEAAKSLWDTVAGFGSLQRYFDDPLVEEIWVNEPSKIFIARGGVAELTATILSADEVRDLVERMLKTSGRRVDLSSPFVDATLADGSRLHVVIPDITRDSASRPGGDLRGGLRAGDC